MIKFAWIFALVLPIQAFAQLDANPPAVDFGDVVVGTSSEQVVTVSNFSSQTLDPVQVNLDGDWVDFQVQDAGCMQIFPNGSCTIWITFFPQTPSYFTSLLTVQAIGDFASVNVSGNGIKSYPVSVVDSGAVGSAL